MNRPLTRIGAALLLAGNVALVSACSSPAPEIESTPTTAPTVDTPAAEPTTEPTGEPAANADPTCETIISDAAVANFDDIGWTAQADVFRIGATEVDGGVMCKWGDLEVASDHVQQFGWAPIDETAAAAAQDELAANGWRTEESPEGLIVTESTATAIAPDEDGYGWTYLFGDGWVKFADTKQSLLLIEWPKV
ncbi:MAG TPA: hypothetical protein VIP50_08155 [Agromyces sp.]